METCGEGMRPATVRVSEVPHLRMSAKSAVVPHRF